MLADTQLPSKQELSNIANIACSEDEILMDADQCLQQDMMKEAFLALVKILPSEILDSKNLSELDILVLAMAYIKRLESVLDENVEMEE